MKLRSKRDFPQMCGWGRQGGTGGWGIFGEMSGKHWEMLSWSRTWGQLWRLWRKLLEQMETKCQSLEKMTMTWLKEKEKIAKQRNKPTGKGSSHNTSSKFQSARLGTENPLRTFEDLCMLLWYTGSMFILEVLLCLHWGKEACRTGDGPCVAARLWWLLCLKGTAWHLKSLMLLRVLPTSFQSPFI